MARLAVLTCALASLLPLAASTSAAPGLKVGVTDDAWLEFGPGTLDDRVSSLRELGTQAVRVTLDWREIEAAQGTYEWDRDGMLLDALRGSGIEPRRGALGDTRLGERRRRAQRPAPVGSHVRVVRAGCRRALPVGAPLDRVERAEPAPLARASLADDVRDASSSTPRRRRSRSVIPRAIVAGGATAPRGGRGGMSPVDFIRGMGRAGARLDAYAHHPHPLSPAETPFTGGCSWCETITMATLDRLVEETRAAFGPRTRIWLTELGYQTNPPDRVLGVTWARQARSVAEAQRRAYEASGVDLLIQYLVRDEPKLGAWQSGLETVAGKVKPAMASFALPLVQVVRKGPATTVWGQVRAGQGARGYVLQRRVGGRWVPLGGPGQTSARGYFTRTVRADRGAQLRLLRPGDPAGEPDARRHLTRDAAGSAPRTRSARPRRARARRPRAGGRGAARAAPARPGRWS